MWNLAISDILGIFLCAYLVFSEIKLTFLFVGNNSMKRGNASEEFLAIEISGISSAAIIHPCAKAFTDLFLHEMCLEHKVSINPLYFPTILCFHLHSTYASIRREKKRFLFMFWKRISLSLYFLRAVLGSQQNWVEGIFPRTTHTWPPHYQHPTPEGYNFL